MKILALHGLGSSAELLKIQLAPFIRDLGPSYEFVFVDGTVPCNRGPAVPAWAPGPFFTWTTGFGPHEMQDAIYHLDDFIKDKGPFSGVLGFSLGASLAMNYILYKQRIEPDGIPDFHFAILFSPIAIASPDDRCYEKLLDRLLDTSHGDFRDAFPQHPDSLLHREDERIFAGYLRTLLSMQDSVAGVLPDTDTRFRFFDRDNSVGSYVVPRLLHPQLIRDRVRIPTVHVSGVKDDDTMSEQSHIAQKLCMPLLATSHRHSGGHDMPFRKEEVQAIVSLILKAVERSTQLEALYDF